MKLLQTCLPAFAETLFELFAAGARLRFVMKDWHFYILIPIFNDK